jgi:hypothetical protein
VHLQEEMMADPNNMPERLYALAKAIERVLNADHGQRHWMKNSPPLDVSYADAVNHYGGPGVGLDLWVMCSAVEQLRIAWLGSNFPLMDHQLPPPVPPILDAANEKL